MANCKTDIFNKYDNLPKDYVPNNRNVEIVVEKKIHPLGVYNANGYLLGYTWNKGDSVTLSIDNIDELVKSFLMAGQTIADYWSKNELEFNVYSLQGELLCSRVPEIEGSSIMRLSVRELDLDSNCYGMELKVRSKMVGTEDLEIHTLIDRGKYNLFIK